MRRRGFTLIELMVVIAILGVFVGLAMIAFGRTRRQADLDRFANDVRDMMTRARRRAVATQSTYILDVRPTTVAYCQRDPNANPAQTTCPTAKGALCNGVLCESVPPLSAGPNAIAVAYDTQSDLGQGPHLALGPAGAQTLFLRSGAADSLPATPVADGFTVYLNAVNDTAQQRKVVLYPAAGRPRLIDRW